MGALKVILISPIPPPAGGIGTWAQLTLNGLKKRSDVDVNHLSTAIGWRRQSQRGVLLRGVGGTIHAAVITLWLLCRIVTFRPSVVHLTSSAGMGSSRDIACLMLCRALRTRTVLHYHISEIPKYRNAFYSAMVRLATRLASRVFVLERRTEEFIAGCTESSKVLIFPNMLDLEQIDGASASHIPLTEDHRSSVKLVFVGHVVPAKGIEELLVALASVDDVVLNVIGVVESGYRSQLEAQHRELIESGRVVFHGPLPRENTLQFVSASDIFALPSRDIYEAFPFSLLEAMALGKPTLVSRVGAMPVMIAVGEEDCCGVCVDPENAESLREGLERMIEQRSQWPDIGKRGRQRVERLYSLDKVVNDLCAQWREVSQI